MENIELKNSSGESISASLFQPVSSNNKFVLINSATGVKQQTYFNVALYLAENGFTVMTYDYRGIGGSKPSDLKDCRSSMRSWGNEDYKAVTDYIKVKFKNYDKYLVGHSVGALILGLNPDSKIFKSFVFISTQKAYVGNLTFKTKLLGYIGFGLIQPLVTKFFGYFPGHRFNLGESLPAAVANDWRTLILNKKSTDALLDKSNINVAKDLEQKVFVLYADDDEWLTKKGVESLLNDTYPKLKPVYKVLKSSESPKNEIGHINFFRSYNKVLWEIILLEFEK